MWEHSSPQRDCSLRTRRPGDGRRPPRKVVASKAARGGKRTLPEFRWGPVVGLGGLGVDALGDASSFGDWRRLGRLARL